ncbi:MAG TPA: hypothetical protein VFX12_01330 [Vicinamibacterales bacterium]|nr:hypothetical protein [Vicinamibacterales bacterium]
MTEDRGDQDEPTGPKLGGNRLDPTAGTWHGAAALTKSGHLPARSEFDAFRDVLADRRQQGLAWVGGDEATTFDQDDAEAYARWTTAADLIWAVIQGEGLLSRTRRRKSLTELWERVDKRASYYRELLRGRRHEKRVGDTSRMSAGEYVAWQARQPSGDGPA